MTNVKVLHGRVVQLHFLDGKSRVVELAPLLWVPEFEDIAGDHGLFAQVKADPETGTIGWPNGSDLEPDVLYGDFEPANPSPAQS